MTTSTTPVSTADLAVLKRVLERTRDQQQEGYPLRQNGRWHFGFEVASHPLPSATAAEWDSLFRLAGIVPDEIVALGTCERCAHALDLPTKRIKCPGKEPCTSCAAPRMTHFRPLLQQAPLIE